MNTTLSRDFDACLDIMRSAGEWRQENSTYSKYWDPELITPNAYLDEFYEDQAWVLCIDGVGVAAATLSEPNRRKLTTWEEDIGEEYASDSSLYLDSLAVRGDMIGQGIISALLSEIERHAQEEGFTALRLDCDAATPKLSQCYRDNGFNEVGRRDVGHRDSVFMEKPLDGDS